MKRHLLALLTLICVLTKTALATTYTVDTSSDPAFTSVTSATGVINDGAGAGLVSLRSAVIAANSSGAGPHVINVPAGTYNLSATNPNTPGTTATTGNPDLQVGSHLSTITIQGTGGTPKIVQTVPGNDVITTGFKADGFTPAVVALTLDNLEITGGTFTGIFVGADDGAGNVSSTTITNCNIHDNSNGHATYGQGGAIQAITGHLSIFNTTFANNSATHAVTGQGGAIYYSLPNPSGLGSTGSLSITGCTFTSNSSALASGVGGGAIYTNVVSAGTTVSIAGNTFTTNSCSAGADGGALAIDGNRTTDVLRNTFVSNNVSGLGRGGAVVVNNGPTNLNYNRFSGNSAATPANGNAIHHSVGNASVVNANDNWWQSNTGPATNAITGATVTAATWLRFTHTASPATVSILSPDNTSTLTASFLTNSANNPVSLANLVTVIGQPISFGSAVLGTLSGAQTTIQSAGTATATFTAGSAPGAGGATATVDSAGAVASITVTAPDMTVAMTHSGNFVQGQTGKTYSITASNTGNATSGGLVSVTINLPSGLTATGLGGTGWTIAPDFLSATRSDALAASTGYPSLTLTVDVAADAGSPLSPSTTISGGGQVNLANDTSVDSTIVLSTDARLSNLSASLGSMSPAFASATTDYVLLVPAGTPSITLTPTVFQANATVTVNGNPVTTGNASGAITIGVGDTIITTLVTAQDGVTQKTYTVTAKTPPALASFTYDAGTGTLVATGSGMTLGDTITVSKLTLSGEGGSTYALTSPDVTASSTTSFTVNLNSTDQAALRLVLNKNGTSSTGAATYNVAAADDWDSSFTSGDTSDVTNPLAVTNVPVPAITSATYDAGAGSLTVTGTGLSGLTGSNNDIIAGKFTITGEGGATYTLTDTANVEVSSPPFFTLTLSATDKAAINMILNKAGTSSTSGTTYNLAAAEDWAAGADPAVVTADLTGNGISVSNVPVPAITSATYNVGTGALSVTGTGFVSLAGSNNDIDLTKITLSGDSTPYTLTTAGVDITSGTGFNATLNATDIAALETRLNKNGTSSLASVTYNLAAAEDWAAGSAAVIVADLTGNGITVSNALNLPPVVTVPANISVTEDTASVLTGISFSDPDAGSSAVTTTFNAGSGTLAATSGGGVTVIGTGTGSVTMTGSISDINSFISGGNLTFLTAANATANVSLGVGINDGGNTGSGGAKSDADSTTLVVTAVNDAPGITAPGSISITEDVAGALTGISFSDADSAASSVSAVLSVGSGVLSATSGGGVTASGGGTGTLTLNGSVSDLNSFIAGSSVTYQTALNATSNVTLGIDLNDNGNSGSGGAKTAATTATLAVTAVNDAPGFSAPTAQSLNQDSSLTFNTANGNRISITDVDAAAGSIQTTLSVTHGTVTLGGTSGLAFSVGSGTGDVAMTFTGTLTNVDNALNGMVFTPTTGYNGPASLQINVDDLGNTGSGGAKSGFHTVNLTVNPINPLVTSVSSSSANGTYKIGDTVNITVTFDMIVNVTGTPSLLLATSPSNRSASYTSGSGSNTLSFAYTIQSGDTASDLDYVNTSSLVLNGGSIKSALTLDAVLTLPTPGGANSIAGQKAIVVDGVRPTATIAVADSALRIGETSLVTITFSEAVSGFINADLTVANGSLGSVSSADGGITWNATFTPDSNVTEATNLITLDNTGVTDAAGNTGSGTTDSNNYAIDTQAPALSNLVRLDSSPTLLETVRYSMQFSEDVTGVDVSDFTLVSTGSATGTITAFNQLDARSYIVSISTITGVGTLGLNLRNSGTGIKDVAGNDIAAGFTGEVYSIDRESPTVASVSVPANAVYRLGQTMDFTVTFSETVLVSSKTTLPRIPITLEHGGTAYADYLSGGGTNELVFRATVQSGQADTDGIALDPAMDPNGAAIHDAVGNAAVLTLNSVASTTGVRVDAIPPVVANGGIPDQKLKVGGVSKTITLSNFFSDIGSTSMTYTVAANSNSGKASATIVADKVTISPIANGITEVTIQADDGHGGTVTDTFQIAVGTSHPTPVQVGTSGTLNKQSGLFVLTVRVTNTTPLPINGFRLLVDYSAYKAAYPSLRLYNASSPPGASKVYVDYPFPVAVDQVVAMKLSFHTSTRTFPSPFEPKLTVRKLAASQVPSSTGEGVQPRLVRKKNGTILLEFDSVVGRWYRVSFTNDLVNWYESPVPIQASTTRMQWIDSGPPFTDVPPARSKMRFYRVNKIKAP